MAKRKNTRISEQEERLQAGIALVKRHPLFGALYGNFYITDNEIQPAKGNFACVTSSGNIYLNCYARLEPEQWAFVIAHCLLHLSFGHFDAEKLPSYIQEHGNVQSDAPPKLNKALWNTACDIYVTKFLNDIKFGKPVCENPSDLFAGNLSDEHKIYAILTEQNHPETDCRFSTMPAGNLSGISCDMYGLDTPLRYPPGRQNHFMQRFAFALANSVSAAVSTAGGHTDASAAETAPQQAARWFIDHYPLLGGLAAHFKIIEDYRYCNNNEISVAAINITDGEIYINPAAGYTMHEWRFILAHEYLHAGLAHDARCKGRNPYLWNVACDFVINGWLKAMQIGTMPADGLLYDETLQNLSAESVYDLILKNLRKYSKLETLRGYGKGDVIHGSGKAFAGSATNVDDFCRQALMQGLEYHLSEGRGYIPAGLIEEIRALAMPPIPWDVQLANWFDSNFAPLEKGRSYARPSRRQASTPDIPRPRYISLDIPVDSRTFGVVIDTSGSMDAKTIGKALGAVASYADAHEVPFARIVFCDACAYDAGYIAPQDIAGHVAVKGRGGTILQPAIDLLEHAADFPKDGPILIITDGGIEDHMDIHHEHAWLLPQGCRLPFHTRSPVFMFL